MAIDADRILAVVNDANRVLSELESDEATDANDCEIRDRKLRQTLKGLDEELRRIVSDTADWIALIDTWDTKGKRLLEDNSGLNDSALRRVAYHLKTSDWDADAVANAFSQAVYWLKGYVGPGETERASPHSIRISLAYQSANATEAYEEFYAHSRAGTIKRAHRDTARLWVRRTGATLSLAALVLSTASAWTTREAIVRDMQAYWQAFEHFAESVPAEQPRTHPQVPESSHGIDTDADDPGKFAREFADSYVPEPERYDPSEQLYDSGQELLEGDDPEPRADGPSFWGPSV